MNYIFSIVMALGANLMSFIDHYSHWVSRNQAISVRNRENFGIKFD